MEILNAKPVTIAIPALDYQGLGGLRAGVVTFLCRGAARSIVAAPITVDGIARIAGIAPIDGHDPDSRPFLQATIIA